MKGIAGFGAAAMAGSQLSGITAAIGEKAVYQYYHTEWTEITQNLPTLADQGYGAIQVPPAQFSRLYEYERQYNEAEGKFDVPLGYQPIDYRNFNSVFGTEEEYRQMVDEAHRQGIEVIADAVINHLAASGNDFGGDNFDRTVPIEDIPYFSDQDLHAKCEVKNGDEEDCWLVGLRDLRHESEYVRGQLRRYVQKYNDIGVDGLRFDAAKHIPERFFSNHANRWTDEFGLYGVGEVLDKNVDYCMQYANTGMSVTDYPLHYHLLDACKPAGYGGDMRALDRDAVVERDPFRALTFVNNHDSPAPDLQKLAYAYILTYEGYPRVYNNEIAFDDDDIRNLLWVRNNLAGGAAYTRSSDRNVYIFERYNNTLTAINNSDSWQTRYPYTSWRDQSLNDYTGPNNSYANDDGYAEVNIPPQGWVVLAP